MYVGVTDYDWYTILKEASYEEVNFWKPGGNTSFMAIDTNDMFLFKLHAPRNYIVGGGYFVRFYKLPIFLAWDTFGMKNGTRSLKELNERVLKYTKRDVDNNLSMDIGCIILTEPFFWEEKDWIPVPEDWSSSIVQGKTYDTESIVGMRLYSKIVERIGRRDILQPSINMEEVPRYGKEQLIKHRLGQGAFRIMVTEGYHRRCSITGEKTLPVLDAAHIKPYAEDGPHIIQNGLLLRSDLHTLYDKGYITVDEKYYVNVSKKLYEDFGNGKIYYAYHGQKVQNMPDNVIELPAKEYLLWHNENVFLG
jgi:putative restriction endonuclease